MNNIDINNHVNIEMEYETNEAYILGLPEIAPKPFVHEIESVVNDDTIEIIITVHINENIILSEYDQFILDMYQPELICFLDTPMYFILPFDDYVHNIDTASFETMSMEEYIIHLIDICNEAY